LLPDHALHARITWQQMARDNPAGGTGAFTAIWPAWVRRSRRRLCGWSSRSRAPIPRPQISCRAAVAYSLPGKTWPWRTAWYWIYDRRQMYVASCWPTVIPFRCRLRLRGSMSNHGRTTCGVAGGEQARSAPVPDQGNSGSTARRYGTGWQGAGRDGWSHAGHQPNLALGVPAGPPDRGWRPALLRVPV